MRLVNGITLLLLILTTGCSTIRMRYEADYKVGGDEQPHHIVLEKSVEVGTPRWVCIFTGWIYGGGCWYYLAMPNDTQEQKIEKSVKERLSAEWNTQNIFLFNDSVERISWDESSDIVEFTTDGKKTYFPKANDRKTQKRPRKRKVPRESLEGFIQ